MLKDIVGLARSRVARRKADAALTGKLAKDIGPEGIVGLRNMATYRSRIGSMVKAGRQQDAVRYSRAEAAKVRAQ